MQLIYEGKDITDELDINQCDFTDDAGNKMDSLIVKANNPNNDWSKWKPQKQDTIEVKKDGFTTSTMYIDDIQQRSGRIILKALPIRQVSKQQSIKVWDDVSLSNIINDVATRRGLTVQTIGIKDFTYSRLNQIAQFDLAFLYELCSLEGYSIKITNNKLVVYDETSLENSDSVLTIAPEDIIGDFNYHDTSEGICNSVTFTDGPISYTATSTKEGAALTFINKPLESIGEAQRYANNIMANNNKYEKTFSCTIPFTGKIAAGNMITVKEFGLADGKYFIDQITHRFANNKTSIYARKLGD